VDLAVGALAVHRLTRLITEDSITEPLRRPVLEDRPDSRLADFLTCPWCVSVWVAAGWLALTAAAPRIARPLGAVLAWSTAAGLLSSLE
jgi:alkylhydroperoxidase family enzyme